MWECRVSVVCIVMCINGALVVLTIASTEHTLLEFNTLYSNILTTTINNTAKRAMKIAADSCVYTNHNFTIETLGYDEEEKPGEDGKGEEKGKEDSSSKDAS